MIDKTFIKRRYYDMRLGGTQVSPIIQMANFTMITFMWINHLIPVEVFAPMFIGLGFIALSYVGVRFRAHQASTDYDMLFEKQTQQAKIFYQMMLAQKDILLDRGIIPSKEFLYQLNYIKKVSEGKV